MKVPAGFDVRHVTAGGLSLALPRRWTTLARQDVVFPGVIRTLSRAHRSLTPHLLGLAAPDSPLKLLAFDGRAGRTSRRRRVSSSALLHPEQRSSIRVRRSS